MANFDSEFFGLVFAGLQASPKNSRPQFTPRIVGIPLQSHFLEPKIYSRRFSAYRGDQEVSGNRLLGTIALPFVNYCVAFCELLRVFP